MLTDNTILVLAIAGVLILLAVVQLLLAARHDRAVTAAGPIEELAIYERRLEEKQRLVDELENELEKVKMTGEEIELLRRFRRTSAENRRMILQILGS